MNGYSMPGARTRRRSVSLVALVALTVGVLAGVPAQADTATTATPGFSAAGGVVRFEHVASGPRVALYETPTSATPVQAIALQVSKKCAVTNLSQLATLLDISVTGASGAVHLVDNGLGVGSNGPGCSTGNGRITAGQSLVVKAGSGLDGDFVSASLNIEGKHGADLGWTARSGGTTVDTGTDPLNGRADTGPDSGAGDNTVVPIAPAGTFDALALTEASGGSNAALSLDNGGDAVDGVKSEFFLGESQEYAVNCTDENTVVESSTGSIGSVTFERLPNGFNPDKDPTCFKVGVTVDIQPEASTEGGEPRDIAFVDNTNFAADGTLQEVRANLTIVWRVPRYASDGDLRTGDALDLELAREITYTDDLADLQDVEWCGQDVAQDDPTFDPEPEHPAGHPWCVVSDDRVIDGDEIVQTVVFHGMGDPKFR